MVQKQVKESMKVEPTQKIRVGLTTNVQRRSQSSGKVKKMGTSRSSYQLATCRKFHSVCKLILEKEIAS